jgi:hypothetical protein
MELGVDGVDEWVFVNMIVGALGVLTLKVGG